MVNISSREFNQDVGQAKKLSLQHPVVITDRGKPSHVLLSYAQYRQLLVAQPAIADLLALPDEIDFEPAKANIVLKPVDLD
jgi:hypothetical protein